MRKPNFFIIGAPKCGTTSLAAWLAEHSQVFFSKNKEPNHFYSPHNPEMSKRKYENLFLQANEKHLAVGEGSVWYLYGAKLSIPRIEHYCKETPPKYIICLRNPSEMALSLHAQKIFSGHENIEDFYCAWKISEDRSMGKMTGIYGIPEGKPGHMAYKESCSIGSQIEILLGMVPSERVLFVFLDDIARNPDYVWSEVQSFLLLKHENRFLFDNKNPATARRFPSLNKALMFFSYLKRRMGFNFETGLFK